MMDYSLMPDISLLGNHLVLLVFAIIWSFIWKGIALWKAARLRQKSWFVAIFLINTFGILEIIYIYFIARKHKVETN